MRIRVERLLSCTYRLDFTVCREEEEGIGAANGASVSPECCLIIKLKIKAYEQTFRFGLGLSSSHKNLMIICPGQAG